MDQLTSQYWLRALDRRVTRRGVLRGATLTGAGLAAAALVGCGGDDAGGESATMAPDAGAGSTATQAPAAANQPKPGGRLNLSQPGDPPSFDLHQESTTYTNYVTSMSYNQLVKMDPLVADENPDSVVADLATEWEISPDGDVYTFHVVTNAKFHDGTPFTSADVKASYERQINPPETLINPPRGAQIQWIDAIETPDDATLVIRMNRPVSALSVLPIFGQAWMAIYSTKDIDGGKDFKKELANGTGPYRMVAYDGGAKVSQDRNPDYFIPDRPYLDGVDVFIVPDESTNLANFQAGQLHIHDPNLEALVTIQDTMGDKVQTQIIKGYGFSTINYGGREPWTDVRVRQAVGMAHNKQVGIDVLAFGDARFGGYMSGGGYWGLPIEEIQTLPGYEPFTDATIAEARKRLDAAGVPAQLDSTILTRLNSEELSLYIQDQMSRIGINATLDIQETATAYDNLAKRTFDMAPWGHAYAVDDPDAVFAEFYITDGPRNYSQVGTAEIDDLYLKQSQEQDPEARRELVHQLERTALPEHGKTIIYWSNRRETIWSTVKDYFTHSSSYNNRRWQDVWLDA